MIITDAIAAATLNELQGPGVQIYIMLIQILWALVLSMLTWFIKNLNSTLKSIQLDFTRLHEKMLTDYATKTELRERVHGMRDILGVHATWIHILAANTKVVLPQSQREDSAL